jgi:hypothetical protein
VFLQQLDHQAQRIDFNDSCEHVIRVLKAPISGNDAFDHHAKFAIVWRLRNSVLVDEQNRRIFDEVCAALLARRISVIATFLFNSNTQQYTDENGAVQSSASGTERNS